MGPPGWLEPPFPYYHTPVQLNRQKPWEDGDQSLPIHHPSSYWSSINVPLLNLEKSSSKSSPNLEVSLRKHTEIDVWCASGKALGKWPTSIVGFPHQQYADWRWPTFHLRTIPTVTTFGDNFVASASASLGTLLPPTSRNLKGMPNVGSAWTATGWECQPSTVDGCVCTCLHHHGWMVESPHNNGLHQNW